MSKQTAVYPNNWILLSNKEKNDYDITNLKIIMLSLKGR